MLNDIIYSNSEKLNTLKLNPINLLLILLVVVSTIGRVDASTFGNYSEQSTFGNVYQSAPEFSYANYSSHSVRNSRNDYEYEPEYRTGRDVNYYNVPSRPGADDCARYDRNYIYCD